MIVQRGALELVEHLLRLGPAVAPLRLRRRRAADGQKAKAPSSSRMPIVHFSRALAERSGRRRVVADVSTGRRRAAAWRRGGGGRRRAHAEAAAATAAAPRCAVWTCGARWCWRSAASAAAWRRSWRGFGFLGNSYSTRGEFRHGFRSPVSTAVAAEVVGPSKLGPDRSPDLQALDLRSNLPVISVCQALPRELRPLSPAASHHAGSCTIVRAAIRDHGSAYVEQAAATVHRARAAPPLRRWSPRRCRRRATARRRRICRRRRPPRRRRRPTGSSRSSTRSASSSRRSRRSSSALRVLLAGQSATVASGLSARAAADGAAHLAPLLAHGWVLAYLACERPLPLSLLRTRLPSRMAAPERSYAERLGQFRRCLAD